LTGVVPAERLVASLAALPVAAIVCDPATCVDRLVARPHGAVQPVDPRQEEDGMRMLLHVTIPHEEFNAAVRDGSAGRKLNRILEETKPETVYFTEYGGERAAIMVVDLEDPSKVPMYAEPWFLSFNADVEFHVAMTPEDLERAGLDMLGKKWS
jgi:hypothetical protein